MDDEDDGLPLSLRPLTLDAASRVSAACLASEQPSGGLRDRNSQLLICRLEDR